MIAFYTFPFLDATDFDEVGDKNSLQVFGNTGKSALVSQGCSQFTMLQSILIS
jgi:hypothetical protein